MASASNSEFSPYKQQGHASALGATEHSLTDSTEFSRHLESRGEHNAEVYNWHISKLPADRVVAMSAMEQLVEQLYMASQALYAQRGSSCSEDAVRRELVSKETAFASMTETHPRLFYALTERTVSAKKRMHIMNMIHIKQKHQEEGLTLKEQQQDISAYMHAMFVRAAEPGEEEAAIAAGTGVRASIEKLPVGNIAK